MIVYRRSMIVLTLFQASIAAAIPFEGHKIVMSGPSPYAIEAGKDVAHAGGNIVDVAVAMALTMSVTSPYFAALGGGGFALVKWHEQPVAALDFREKAPAATSRDYFLRLKNPLASRIGGTAVGVPGIPAGLFALHQKYGKRSWKSLFKKSEELALKGFQLSGEWVQNTEHAKPKFNPAGLDRFFKRDHSAYLPGDVLIQKKLTAALALYKNEGPKGIYEGSVATDLVHAVKTAGGVLTVADLANYKVRWLPPLETDFQGFHLYLMPPPSSGGVIIKTALQLVEKAKVFELPFLSALELHWLTEIESRSFRERILLGDPDFHKNPTEQLHSTRELDFLFKSINPKKATSLRPLNTENLAQESTETTHLSVLDAEGNAISMTLTLNGDYGSGVVSPRYGIALNNEMDDFTTVPDKQNMFGLYQGEGNAVQHGKRPLSSMSPTLVEKDGKIVLALGAPGGPRIISAVFQVLYRILAQGLDPDRAIQTARVHHQFQPDIVYVDKARLSTDVIESLRKMGHKVEESSVGKVYAVKRNENGVLEGAFDSRGEGAVGGY